LGRLVIADERVDDFELLLLPFLPPLLSCTRARGLRGGALLAATATAAEWANEAARAAEEPKAGPAKQQEPEEMQSQQQEKQKTKTYDNKKRSNKR
jgi:hypothetical protein